MEMKVAIMQPYFFPYIGYVQLMHHADNWVVFDDILYLDKGWICLLYTSYSADALPLLSLRVVSVTG